MNRLMLRKSGSCARRIRAPVWPRLVPVWLLLAMGAAAAQSPADVERGRALYENHCQVCHTPRVHSRVNQLPINRAELRNIVDRWQQEEKLRWTGQDIADVVEYLSRTRYGYGAPRPASPAKGAN